MMYLAHKKVFKNMLQLKRFGLYFEKSSFMAILSYRNNDIGCTQARGFRGMFSKKILNE